MGKLLEIKTEHVATMKSLFELLKDVFDDLNMECIRDDEMNKKDEELKLVDTTDDFAITKVCDTGIEHDNSKKKKKSKSKVVHDRTSEEDDESKIDESKKDDTLDDDKDKKSGGIKIIAMDKTQTLLVNVKLNAKKFDIFKMKKKVFDIGINLNHLYKLLRSLQKDDSLTLCVNEEDVDWLLLKKKNDLKRYEKTERVKLMDINKTKYDIPPTAFDVVITIETSEFHSICKELSQIEQVVEIKCTKKCLTFSGKGDSLESSQSYYPDENGIKIKFSKQCKQDIIQGIFELKYLVMFTNKSQNLCPRMRIFMKNNYPLCVKFTVATLGNLLFCVSPYNEDRISKDFEDDEEYYEEDKTEYV